MKKIIIMMLIGGAIVITGCSDTKDSVSSDSGIVKPIEVETIEVETIEVETIEVETTEVEDSRITDWESDNVTRW